MMTDESAKRIAVNVEDLMRQVTKLMDSRVNEQPSRRRIVDEFLTQTVVFTALSRVLTDMVRRAYGDKDEFFELEELVGCVVNMLAGSLSDITIN